MFLGLFQVYSDIGVSKYNMTVSSDLKSMHDNMSKLINDSDTLSKDAYTRLTSNSTTDLTSAISLTSSAFSVLTFLPKVMLFITKIQLIVLHLVYQHIITMLFNVLVLNFILLQHQIHLKSVLKLQMI